MDTPGLLERPDDFRNKMELLTLAALQYLPSSVMFVADLTEECGTGVAEQWLIRQELKDRFPHKPWVDVLSKADLLEDVWQEAAAVQQQQEQQEQQEQGRGDGEGIHDSEEVQTAVQFAAALPEAVKVSSLTEEGFRQLQEELVVLLKSEVAVAQLAAAAAADAAAAAAEAEAAALAAEGLLPPSS
jgi:GTPase Era involved in 16S rRNA processing